jgi:hypothetical protein
MKILALLILAFAYENCWAQQQNVPPIDHSHKNPLCSSPSANCVIVTCFGIFRAKDLIDPNGKQYIVPDASRYPTAGGFGGIQIAGPLPGNHKILLTYSSNFEGKGEVLAISKDNLDGTTFTAMSNAQNPSAALTWGASQGTPESTWEIYCKKEL